MKYLILLIMLFSTQVLAEWNNEFDYTQVAMEHAWRGPNNKADFNEKLEGIGITAWHDSNFGVRLGYLKGKSLHTEGRYSFITMNMKHIISLELLYKYEIIDDLNLILGVGTHLIPVPMYWDGIDPTSHAATDADNDEGYIIGLQKCVDSLCIGWRFTHYSRIKSNVYDEWTKGHSLNVAYRF